MSLTMIVLVTVLKIADKISKRMNDVETALRSLKTAVETDQQTDAVPQDCCMDGVYQENVRFRANVTYLRYDVCDIAKTKSTSLVSMQKVSLKCIFRYRSIFLTLFILILNNNLTNKQKKKELCILTPALRSSITL